MAQLRKIGAQHQDRTLVVDDRQPSLDPMADGIPMDWANPIARCLAISAMNAVIFTGTSWCKMAARLTAAEPYSATKVRITRARLSVTMRVAHPRLGNKKIVTMLELKIG